MSKNTKKLVPKLRFPEFRDLGDWAYLNGNDVFDQISNKKHSSDLPILAITQEYGAIPRDQIDYHVSVTDKSVESYKVVEIGDFIISLRSFQGGIEYSDYKGLCSPAYVILRKKMDVSNLFFKNYFKSNILIADLNKDIEGIRDGKMVSFKQFSELLLPAPQLDEQKKIADCLSSIDDLINAQSQKVEALKIHKKGLMQQLFPHEGETVPRLRFPEFRDAAEWAILPFKEIAKFLSGGTPSKDVPEYWGGAIPWISASSMHTTKIDKSDSNITELAVSDGAKIAKKGTLLLLVRGSMLHKRIPIGITETDVSFNQDVKALQLKGDISEHYLMTFLIASESKLLAAVTATGIGAGKLDTSDLNDFPIRFPSPAEQKKVSDCLSSIDDLISAQSQKLETLKSYKNGLMQQLFPSTEADSE